MENHIPVLMNITYISFFLVTIIITTFFPHQSHSQTLKPPQSVNDYSTCKDIKNSYNCHKNITTILISSQNFTVLEINTKKHTIKLKRTDLSQNLCSPQFNDTYFSPTLLQYLPSVKNITIYYNCTSNSTTQPLAPYSLCGSQNHAFYNFVGDGLEEPINCKRHIQVPVGADFHFPKENDYYGIFDHDAVESGLDKGFEVKYSVNEECLKCLGRDEGDCSSEYIENCSSHHNSKQLSRQGKLEIILGVGSAAMVALLMCIIICCYRRKSSILQVKFWLKTENDIDIEAFLKDHGALLQKRYKFSEIKKMTNSFKIKLGQGGFGVVYKGKLFNGSLVAVKILNASKGNGEEFINEVASITRTSHVNVVTLLGFCFEGRKKALIYEFMSNGSLDKFIYNKGPETIASLSWDNLYQIAKGIARGLEYLHRGCNTRILHFDIKPHNILLDENLCPKISDFGLAKLCLKKESTIFMSNARGTVGYVAPEVCNRQFGGVSHKSDVYSYGMMLLEMVGVRNNIDVKTNQTSEYFPDWIYKRLEMDKDLRPDIVMAIEENEIAKGMTIVGLWCIQTLPNDRPTMSRVIEMLEGSMNVLEIPPKPLVSSPSRSLLQSSTS